MNKILRSRRGIGIEMALFLLVTVFGLCTIIMTFSMIVWNLKTNQMADFRDMAEVEQLGEQFIVGDGSPPPQAPEGYTVSVSGDSDSMVKTLTVRNAAGDTVLTVTYNFYENIVLCWK